MHLPFGVVANHQAGGGPRYIPRGHKVGAGGLEWPMLREPEDALERCKWYQAKAEHARGLAADAPLMTIRDSYLALAKRYDGLADQAEKLHG